MSGSYSSIAESLRVMDELRPRRRSALEPGGLDTEVTVAERAAMQEELRGTFQAYGFEAIDYRASMNVHGGHEWTLTVRVPVRGDRHEVRRIGSRIPEYIEGRRGDALVNIDGDNRDIQRAPSHMALFRQIAEAIRNMVGDRLIGGETLNVSCHELLHRYRSQIGYNDPDDRYYPLHLRHDFHTRNELRDHWGFSAADVEKVEKKLAAETHGPTEAELEASYRV